MQEKTKKQTYPIPTVRSGFPETHSKLQSAPQHAENLGSSLNKSINQTFIFLKNAQSSEGYWWGELESNTTMEAEYLFLTHFLGIVDSTRRNKIKNFIISKQQSDGGWSQYYGAASDLSTSCESYLALKLCGVPSEHTILVKARGYILGKGGVSNSRVFTKIWFALLGVWDWKGTPFLPPEIMLIPDPLPFNIYKFAMWARATIVPMAVLLSRRPVRPVPEGASIDELYVNGRKNTNYSLPKPNGIGIEWFFHIVDRLLSFFNGLKWNPIRSHALRLAEKWIRSHQEADGSWGGIQPPWVYSLMALSDLGSPNTDHAIKRGIEGFERYAIEEEETWRLQPSISPLWDTALVVNALLEAGFEPNDPSIVRASDWLTGSQIHHSGDWKKRARDVTPGGWAFEFHNINYPDIDDTSLVLYAIGRGGTTDKARRDRAVRRGIDWIMALQSNNGGWAAYDKNNTSQIVSRLPFFDFGETIDPPSVDVTAHILEMLGALGHPLNTNSIRHALDYIWSEQEEDGCWFGRWGTNYIYGTAAVLPALRAIGHNMSDSRVRSAANWIETHQNNDNGWGESCSSYADPTLRGQGQSTPSQTAWAIIGLIGAGRSCGDSAKRGVEFLLSNQNSDGTWTEPFFTGTGFPGYGLGERRFTSVSNHNQEFLPNELPTGFMIKYHMYRIYWPMIALARYRRELG